MLTPPVAVECPIRQRDDVLRIGRGLAQNRLSSLGDVAGAGLGEGLVRDSLPVLA
jgi:hypothetical protein